jgi:serine/threonine protein phosphatase PrpC
MMSDGIVDSNKEDSEQWIISLLMNTTKTNPYEIADYIIEYAHRNYGTSEKDDMTIIVGKIC